MVQHKGQVLSAQPRTADVQLDEDVTFKAMLLPKPILRGLKKARYITPSPIQKKALPLVRCGLDLIVQAKAGTGKTCVFTLAALEMVRTELSHVQAIVLAPTREVALQITDVVNAIGSEIDGLKIGCFIGGYPVKDDEKKASCHIAVGTPGRLKHLVDTGVLKVNHVRLFILDEADKLMESVFVPDINAIYQQLPKSKQVLVCSATYTPELIELLGKYMHRGQYITSHCTVNPTVLLGVRQLVSVVPLHVDKLATLKLKERKLCEILRLVPFNQCLVFSNLHSRAESVCGLLSKQGFGADWIAGKQQQADRVIALAQLREQRVRVLVTTDLTARGIDVENVNLVINLDLPPDHHTYLHRMGRAGRYGAHGMVITIVPGQEVGAFRKVLGKIGGTSQSVRCLPEDLKSVDLRTVPDEDLEEMFGTVEEEEPSEESDFTGTEDKLSKDSNSRKKTKEGSYATNSSALAANGARNNHNVEESSGNRTDTDEKFSQDSTSDSNEDMEDNEKESEIKCSCGLYKVEQNDLEVITQPSLFACSEAEDHWTDVLPVIISEKRIPLNTKVALVGSKFIRIRSLDRSKGTLEVTGEDLECGGLVDFGTESRVLEDIPNFKDLIATIEKKPVENECIDKGEGSDRKDDFPDSKQKNDVSSKLEKLKERLEFFKRAQQKRENFFRRFDSFDVVGWVAVDLQDNILDHLTIDNGEIFQFNLKTCAAGESHIEVQSVTNTAEVDDDVRPFDDHISTFNLAKLNLVLPAFLKDIADKLKALDKAVEPGISEVPSKLKVCEANEKSVKSTKCSNKTQKGQTSKFLNGTTKSQQNGHCKTNGISKHSQKPNSLESMQLSGLENSNSKKKKLPKQMCNGGRKIQPPKNSLPKPSVDENVQKPLESKSIKSRNSNEKKSKANVSNDARQSSAGSEDSGSYVDMSKNLMKWQELHDCDESDSETSSDSEVLNPSLSQRVRDTYSDSSDCSYETSQAIKQREVRSRLSKNKSKRQSEKVRKPPQQSHDTVEPTELYKQDLNSKINLTDGAKEDKKPRRNKKTSGQRQSEIDKALKEFLEAAQSTVCKNQSYQEENSQHVVLDHKYVPDKIETKQSKKGSKHKKLNSLDVRYSSENCVDPKYFRHDYVPDASENVPGQSSFTEYARNSRNFIDPLDSRYYSHNTSDSRNQRHFSQNLPDPSTQTKSKQQKRTDSHRKNRREPKFLTSNHLLEDWSATWYAEVRQRAQQLEFAAYIDCMTSNL